MGWHGVGRERKLASLTSLKLNLWAETSSVLELIAFMVFHTVNLANTVLLIDHFSGQTFKETKS